MAQFLSESNCECTKRIPEEFLQEILSSIQDYNPRRNLDEASKVKYIQMFDNCVDNYGKIPIIIDHEGSKEVDNLMILVDVARISDQSIGRDFLLVQLLYKGAKWNKAEGVIIPQYFKTWIQVNPKDLMQVCNALNLARTIIKIPNGKGPRTSTENHSNEPNIKLFKNKFEMNQAIESVKEWKNFHCCGNAFNSPLTLSAHYNKTHLKLSDLFVCPFDHCIFTRREDVNYHIANAHLEIAKFRCWYKDVNGGMCRHKDNSSSHFKKHLEKKHAGLGIVENKKETIGITREKVIKLAIDRLNIYQTIFEIDHIDYEFKKREYEIYAQIIKAQRKNYAEQNCPSPYCDNKKKGKKKVEEPTGITVDLYFCKKQISKFIVEQSETIPGQTPFVNSITKKQGEKRNQQVTYLENKKSHPSEPMKFAHNLFLNENVDPLEKHFAQLEISSVHEENFETVLYKCHKCEFSGSTKSSMLTHFNFVHERAKS